MTVLQKKYSDLLLRQSPTVTLDRLPFGDRELVRYKQRDLHVESHEDGKHYIVYVPDIDMAIVEESFDELQVAVEEAVCVMWEWYVMNEDEKMTDGAMKLREKLNNTYQVV